MARSMLLKLVEIETVYRAIDPLAQSTSRLCLCSSIPYNIILVWKREGEIAQEIWNSWSVVEVRNQDDLNYNFSNIITFQLAFHFTNDILRLRGHRMGPDVKLRLNELQIKLHNVRDVWK